MQVLVSIYIYKYIYTCYVLYIAMYVVQLNMGRTFAKYVQVYMIQ